MGKVLTGIVKDDTGEIIAFDRSSFIFYRSYKDTYDLLPAEQKPAFIEMIMSYGLDFTEPSRDNPVYVFFPQIKAQMDANNKKALDGAKSPGRPPKQDTTKGKFLTDYDNQL